MVTRELLQYIVKEEQLGFSEQQIRTALKKSGYPTKDIVEAFRSLDGAHDDTVHGYVQEYARAGKPADETFVQLHQQGYDAGNINNSIHNVYGKNEHRPHTVMFVFIALILGAGLMYFWQTDLSSGEIPQPVYSPTDHIATALEETKNGRDGLESCEEELDGKYLEQCYAVIASATSDSTICSKIFSDDIHDSCLMSFIDVQFDAVCVSVRLAENKRTCDSLRALQV